LLCTGDVNDMLVYLGSMERKRIGRSSLGTF